jgi:hypothetical protein
MKRVRIEILSIRQFTETETAELLDVDRWRSLALGNRHYQH